MDSQADSPRVEQVNSLQLPSPARWDGCLAVGTAVSVTVTRVAYAALVAAALAVLQSGSESAYRTDPPSSRHFGRSPPARASSTMKWMTWVPCSSVDDRGWGRRNNGRFSNALLVTQRRRVHRAPTPLLVADPWPDE